MTGCARIAGGTPLGFERFAGARGHRQYDAGLQAAPRSILENDLSAMALDNGLCHGQPQADTAGGAIARFINPIVRTEHVVEGVRGYAGPSVPDGHD